MKVSTSLITAALCLAARGSDGFSVSPPVVPPYGSRSSPLAAKTGDATPLAEFAKSVGIVSAAVVLLSGVAVNPAAAAAVEARPSVVALESSGVALSLGEYADFTMPSYKDATAAAPMTNLTGGDRIAQSSFGDSSPDASGDSKPLDAAAQAKAADDKKAAAAEKKIQQKAARVRQLAEAEAAAAAAANK